VLKYWESSNDIAYQDSLKRGVDNLVDVAMAAYEANPPSPNLDLLSAGSSILHHVDDDQTHIDNA
jgi:hypothetical protein